MKMGTQTFGGGAAESATPVSTVTQQGLHGHYDRRSGITYVTPPETDSYGMPKGNTLPQIQQGIAQGEIIDDGKGNLIMNTRGQAAPRPAGGGGALGGGGGAPGGGGGAAMGGGRQAETSPLQLQMPPDAALPPDTRARITQLKRAVQQALARLPVNSPEYKAAKEAGAREVAKILSEGE
jgi:hypothetical protein